VLTVTGALMLLSPSANINVAVHMLSAIVHDEAYLIHLLTNT